MKTTQDGLGICQLQALATFTAYASYPTLDCLSQNFVQCGQAIKQRLKYDKKRLSVIQILPEDFTAFFLVVALSYVVSG